MKREITSGGERLPAPFRELEPFCAWTLASEDDRQSRRLASTIEELRAFYAAITPRIDAIVAYLNQFALDEMPAPARNLLCMALSWTEIASAVEIYQQATVINGLDPRRFIRLKE